jgi:OmpA-like transmembrane domain
MAARKTGWLVGSVLVGSALCANAMADGGPFDIYNPLGVYVGAGLGRSTLSESEFNQFGGYYDDLDGNPLGWKALVGIRPIPFLGAEAEYIDFGNAHIGPYGPNFGGSNLLYVDSHAHDRAGAIFAVGYLPVPIPWIEPFGKLGWAQIWQHDTVSGTYLVNGAPTSESGSQTAHSNGAAYGGGVQFHFQQLAVRAEYERISGSGGYGGWNNPALLSVGVNWTF